PPTPRPRPRSVLVPYTTLFRSRPGPWAPAPAPSRAARPVPELPVLRQGGEVVGVVREEDRHPGLPAFTQQPAHTTRTCRGCRPWPGAATPTRRHRPAPAPALARPPGLPPA